MSNSPNSGYKLTLAAILGLIVGLLLAGHPSVLPTFVRNVFVEKTPGRTFDQALDLIEDDYYRKVKSDEVVNASLNAAVKSLHDQFSYYFDPRTYAKYQIESAGEFQGIGVTISGSKLGLKIVMVIPNSPAQEAGIKRGSVITAVNGHSIKGEKESKAVSRLKGPVGTTVTLTVLYQGKSRKLKLERANFKVPQIHARTFTTNGVKVAYVQLFGFNSGSSDQVRNAIERRLKTGAKAVVLDLRGNPGGFVEEAVGVASVFIPKGTIVKTKGRSVPTQTYNATGDAIKAKIPVVVLVNHDTASAAEIVSAALQDTHRGIVVGEHTFGKGVFGQIHELENGGALDLVAGEYFTPKGRNLGGGGVRKGAGVKPDIRAVDKAKTKQDEALNIALDTAAANAK